MNLDKKMNVLPSILKLRNYIFVFLKQQLIKQSNSVNLRNLRNEGLLALLDFLLHYFSLNTFKASLDTNQQ